MHFNKSQNNTKIALLHSSMSHDSSESIIINGGHRLFFLNLD